MKTIVVYASFLLRIRNDLRPHFSTENALV